MAIYSPAIICGDPQNKNFNNYPTGTIICDPKTAGLYTVIGGQSVAIGVNNKITSATSYARTSPSGKNIKYSIGLGKTTHNMKKKRHQVTAWCLWDDKSTIRYFDISSIIIVPHFAFYCNIKFVL